MALSQQDALDSLGLIKDTASRTHKVLAADYAGNLLILWGLISMAGFSAVEVFGHRGGYIFGLLDGVGVLVTLFICRRWPLGRSVQGAGSLQIARRILVFWLILSAYAVLWMLLLRPATGMQVGAFLVTVAMLGWVVIGLWTGSLFMLWLGLAVTVLTLFGFYLIPGWFNLWMALTVGGTSLGAGLYVRIRWR